MGLRERRLWDLLTENGEGFRKGQAILLGQDRGVGQLEPKPTKPREGVWGRVQTGEGRAYRVI